MAGATQDVLAIPDKRARELAGVTVDQLRYWERIGLVVPSIKRQISPRNIMSASTALKTCSNCW